jgi:hypothetical protein
MKAKIKKRYFGDEYLFYVYTKPNTMHCIVRQSCTSKEIQAIISDDFKKVILKEGIKIEGIRGQNPKVIYKLTLNKHYSAAVENEILSI